MGWNQKLLQAFAKAINNNMNKASAAFTLVEILVVTSIIGLLAAAGTVTYTAFTKNSRDARRKADLEQIRGAAELYRSNSQTNSYPAEDEIVFNCPGSGALTDVANNTYMSKVPNDPKCPTYTYYYEVGSDGNYKMGAFLEGGGGTDCSVSCGGANCNYCVGPYGEQ